MGEFVDVDKKALELWLVRALGDVQQLTVRDFGRPKSGYSAETLIFEADVQRGSVTRTERFVLRRQTPDPPVYPQQTADASGEVALQYRAMRTLAEHSAAPIAPLLGFEADAGVLGAPFFVMRFVAGEVPIESPAYTKEGFFVTATPEQRRRMLEDGLRQLARVHAIDWRAAGLDWLTPPGVAPGTRRQLALWEAQARRELGDRVHPPLFRALAWLNQNVPDDPALGLCWGDARLGNIIWRDFRAASLTDFEAVAIASPVQDLGWWLMFDRWMHEPMGGPRLPGEPTRDEQRALYAEFAGIALPDTRFHEVFAAARYAAIVVRVMNRAVARGDMPADQRIWIENPVVPTLNEILDEYEVPRRDGRSEL